MLHSSSLQRLLLISKLKPCSCSQLLVRWLQHGALSAVDRTHCGGCNREFWTFPNFAAMKDAMHFRTALFPYIYAENHATRSTGISLLHPLYYAEGASTIDRAYATTTSYLFGSSLLVAPIVQPILKGNFTDGNLSETDESIFGEEHIRNPALLRIPYSKSSMVLTP